jgi:hypothetical protein
MIPKVINFYWSGSKMSWLRYMTLYSFRKLNSDWEMNLYHDAFTDVKERTWKEDFNRQDFFDYKGDEHLKENILKDIGVNRLFWFPETTFGLDMNVINPSQRSNFFKWDMLSKGCYYSDMDIVFTRSMDDIYEQTKNFDAGLSFQDYFSIGFMFGSVDNALFKKIYENACRTFDPTTYQGAGVDTLYRRWKNLAQMQDEFPQVKIFNVPKFWFYYFDHLHIPMVFEEDNFLAMPVESYGIHWYAGSPLSQKFNNIISALTTSDTTITKALSKLL